MPRPLGIIGQVFDPPSPRLRDDVIDWCSEHLHGGWRTRYVHGISPRIREILEIDGDDPEELFLAGKKLAPYHAVIEIADSTERTHFVLRWLCD